MSITTYLNKSRIMLALVLSTVLGTAQANEPPVYKLTLAETWGLILQSSAMHRKTWRNWPLKCPMAAFKSVSTRPTNTKHRWACLIW